MPNYQVTGPDGSQYQITAPDDATAQKALSDLADQLGPGKWEAFGRGALRNFPMAQQATAALESGDYSQNIADLTQKAEEAKAAHPVAYGTGAVTGTLAPLALPGVGEALESAPVATNIGLGALQNLSDVDIAQQPKEALKSAGIGGAVGGATAGILGTLASPIEEGAEKLANIKAVQATGFKPGQLGIPQDEYEQLGQTIKDLGLVQGSTQDRYQLAKGLLDQTGQSIGGMGVGAQPLQDATPYWQELRDKLQNSLNIFGEQGNPEVNIYQRGMQNLRPGMTFDELQQLKIGIGERAFDINGNVANQALADVYGQTKQAMKDIIAGSPDEYQKVMDQYAQLSDITAGLKRQLQQEQAQGTQAKGFGMVGRLMAMAGKHPMLNVGAAAALAPAHPLMSIGALTPLLMNPQALSEGASTVASMIPKAVAATSQATSDVITKHLLNNPQVFGKYAQPLLQAAQTGGQSGIAATHFLLASQYPEYNQLTQDLSPKDITENQ